MKTFAYIVTPITIKELKNYWPAFRILPDLLIKPFINSLPSFKVLSIKKIKSIKGKEIEGFLIIAPLIGRQLSEDVILDKIISAGQIAQRLGAKIIGLGGHAALYADNASNKAFRNLKIPITTGNALTAWSVVEQLYRVAKIQKIELKKYSIAILNAGNPAGSLCSKKLSDYANRIIISDKDTSKLEKLKDTISYLNPIEVQIEEDAHKAAKKANITINTNDTQLNIEDLHSNAIFCSIYPNNNSANSKKLRSDITFIEAGLVRVPFPEKLYTDFGLPRGIISTSMAETMLLTLEEKFVSYSLGDKINVDKLEEIADIAVQHGFEIWAPDAPVI